MVMSKEIYTTSKSVMVTTNALQNVHMLSRLHLGCVPLICTCADIAKYSMTVQCHRRT